MFCRCPACQAKFDIPTEQIDFLVRCDSCRCMFIARSPESVEFARKVAAQIEAAASAPPSEDSDELEEVAQVAHENHLAEIARARLRPTAQQKELQRFRLRWRQHALGIISLCGLLGVVLLAGLVFVLNTLRPANAANSSSVSAPSGPASSSPKTPSSSTVRSDETAPSPPTGTGELFPDVKGQ